MTRPNKSPDELLEEILAQDTRYSREAYAFVSEALTYTVQAKGEPGHVTGKELCEGLAAYGLQQFGRLARPVLQSWGIRTSEDIGEIVFNMVDVGLLRKTDEDSREDFAGVIDFEETFEQEFRIEIVPGDADGGTSEP